MDASARGTKDVNVIAQAAQPAPLHLEGLWTFTRPAHFTGRARSTPNHLVHLVEAGSYRLALAGRTWMVQAPSLIWYHGAEAVAWQGDPVPVRFLSCAFSSPRLRPPPAAQRVVAAPAEVVAGFHRLVAASAEVDDLRAALRCHAAACAWLEAVLDAFAITSIDLWERVERQALASAARPSLDRLAAWAGVSLSTLERACRQRHGCSPGIRLRRLRVDLARALIAQGGLSRPGAARLLGYADRRSLRRALIAGS